MAAPSDSINTVLRVLNLNQTDSNAYIDMVNECFGNRENVSSDESESNCEDSEESTTVEQDEDEERESDNFTPVTVDLAEQIVPLGRGKESLPALPRSETPSSSSTPASLSTSTSPSERTQFSCKCSLNNGNPCFSVFTWDEIESCRFQYLSLSREELDIAILSKLACTVHLDSHTRRPKQKTQTVRKSSRTDYLHHGHRICRDFFMYIHDIGKDKLTALIKFYKTNGVEARTHKNTKRKPSHALTYQDTRRVMDFIINYAEVHSIQLPGRTPTHWKCDTKLLPTSYSKQTVYDEYTKASASVGHRIIQISLFRTLWEKLVPFIRTMPPASDLCWICQKGAAKIARSANRTDDEKGEALRALTDHQSQVRKEREYYQKICKEVKDQLPADINPGPKDHCSFKGKNHVSFDFAQQVHYPYNPLQPGPIFFKTPRKCGLFGINCEPIRKQVNYAIDEAHCCGKGANTVISLLHHYLENFSFGETDLHLHADNCAGQNKNSTMIWYLMWRCVNGYNTRITLSFLVSGHTKFSPDGGFGLIKRKFKRTKIDCLQDITDVINQSSEMNSCQIIGTENGQSLVPTYNWADFLKPFCTKLKGITKFHHVSFSGDGIVKCKFNVDSEEESHSLLKKHLKMLPNMPPIILPNGLPLKRKWYLYNEIRPFTKEECQDTVSPRPSQAMEEGIEEEEEEEGHQPAPQPKKRRKT